MRLNIQLWEVAAIAVSVVVIIPCTRAQTKSPNKGSELPAAIPPPDPSVDQNCTQRWMREPSFMMWLVRITLRRTTPPNKRARWDRGTGSLISKRHVLTSCFPVVITDPADISLIDIFPAAIRYAAVVPSEEKGTFPWAEAGDGCFDFRYTVLSTIAPRGCNVDYENDPSKEKPFLMNATADNYLILALAQEIPLLTANSQYMPFDFNINRNLRTIRWFQSVRRSRCVIPRFTKLPDGSLDLPKQTIEQEGYTYRSMPFEQECLVKLCSRYCDHEENFNLQGGSKYKCNAECKHSFGRKFHGQLLCLQRMLEHIEGKEKYSVTLDMNNVQTPLLPKDAPSKENCKETSVVYGAPVVCNGEVIAIVTQCFENEEDPYLVATTLNPIHHQLLKWGPIF